MAEKGSGHKTDEVFDAMKKLYDNGVSMTSISKAMPGHGCAETIRKEFVRRNVLRRSTGPSRNEIDTGEMVSLYQQGMSLNELGKRYDVSPGTINNHLIKVGIPKRKRGSSGAKSGRWKGGIHVKKSGHIYRKSPTHPNCNHLGYVPEHRLIVEEALGCLLLPCEVVHHRDQNPGNNKLDNLQLFCSRDEHDLYGHPERIWGITREKIAAMLARIRKQRSERRQLLGAKERTARKKFLQRNAHYEIRAKMVTGLKSRYVNIPTQDGARRQKHEHREVMQRILKRKLSSREIVHHEDANKANNNIENLFLFSGTADHIKYHNWRGILHFRGKTLADKFFIERCLGMHNILHHSI